MDNTGNEKITVTLYRIENPYFTGYHEFLLMSDDDGTFLVDSWAGKYGMKYRKVDSVNFRQEIIFLYTRSIQERKQFFAEYFIYVETEGCEKADDMKISSITMDLYYNNASALNYPTQIPNNKFLLHCIS